MIPTSFAVATLPNHAVGSVVTVVLLPPSLFYPTRCRQVFRFSVASIYRS
jgi:hypothetical protein